MQANVMMPPCRVRPLVYQKTIFLAGAIDNGAAIDWQRQVTDQFHWNQGVVFYNPRRADWDSSWVQSADNPQFAEQVEWELDMIERADEIIMFFPANSIAPITLLELGIIASSYPSKLIIAAEKGYWRRGNIEILCRRNRIDLYESLDECIIELGKRL